MEAGEHQGVEVRHEALQGGAEALAAGLASEIEAEEEDVAVEGGDSFPGADPEGEDFREVVEGLVVEGDEQGCSTKRRYGGMRTFHDCGRCSKAL